MVEQGQDDPGSSGVGQCTTQAVHHVETRSNSQHGLNYTARSEYSVTGVKGKLKGKKPKLSPSQRKHLLTLHTAGEHTQAELAELFSVSRTTIYRELRRTTGDT